MVRVRVGLAVAILALAAMPPARGDVTAEQVERAIRRGVGFLKGRQKPDGSWPGEPGMTALVSLALVTAGESPDSPAIDRAFRYLLAAEEGSLTETYTLGLEGDGRWRRRPRSTPRRSSPTPIGSSRASSGPTTGTSSARGPTG